MQYPSQEVHLYAASALAFSSPIHETNTELDSSPYTAIRQKAPKVSIVSPKSHLGPRSSSPSKQNPLLDDRDRPYYSLARDNNEISAFNDFSPHPFSPEEIECIDSHGGLLTSKKSEDLQEIDNDGHHQFYSASSQKLDYIALAEYLTTPKPRKQTDGLVDRFWFYSEAVGVLQATFLESFDFSAAE